MDKNAQVVEFERGRDFFMQMCVIKRRRKLVREIMWMGLEDFTWRGINRYVYYTKTGRDK